MSKNRVNVLGHLGRDPEMRYLPDGTPSATISLATTEAWTDKHGERKEHTEWHRVVFFRGLAEVVGKYLCQGAQVDIEGKLRTRKWTDKDGVERWSTEIVAKEIRMLGGKRKPEAGQADGQRPAADAPKGKTPGPRSDDGPYIDDSMDDDIPF